MGVVVLLVFLGVFTVIAAILMLGAQGNSGTSKKQKDAVLNAALGISNDKKKKKSADAGASYRKQEIGSSIPFLNRQLEKLAVGPRMRTLLNQAALSWTPGRLVMMSLAVGAGAAYLAYLRTDILIVGVVTGAICSVMPTLFVIFKRSQRFGKFEQNLPDALEIMVSALRVGHSFNSVMGLITRECAEPIKGEFRIVFDEQNYGLDIRSALSNLTTRVPLQDLRIAVTAILIQRESGGNLAEVLEKTAHVIRERFRLKKQVAVHTAQGRLTGLILTILPLGLGVALYFANPDTMSLLWKRDLGIKMMWAAAGMLTVGTIAIQKIVRMDV